MKRALILMLALVLGLAVLGLAACGGTEETTTTAASTATTAAPATDTTAAPATDTTAAPTDTTEAAANAQEDITIKYAVTGQETETVGQEVKYFADYVSQKVPAVKFDIYYGGTLASGMEDLPLLSSGGVDMISLGHPPYGNLIPLLQFPMFAPGGEDKQTAGIDYFTTLTMTDPETSPLIQAEAEANNVKYLGWMSTGYSAFEAKKPFTAVSDLVGGKFGNGGDPTPYQAMGLTVVQVFPPDGYEALRTGIIDSTSMGFAPMVYALKWYEVAPYFLIDNTIGAGQCITINLDTWNKLTPETQAIFQEAADATAQYSIQLTAEQTAAAIQIIKDNKGEVNFMSDEEAAQYYALYFKSAADSAYAAAADKGAADQMTIILKKAAALTGQTWEPPAM